MRGCPTCGTSFRDDVAFCPEDGIPLPEPDPLLGRVCGSYRVMRLLGSGGMGAVYLGQHPVIGSKVAIKFLHPRFSNDRRAVSRFFNEAKAVNVVGHDNIVHVVDLATTDDGLHYLVMEYLEGEPLDGKIRRQGVLPPVELAAIAIQCCEALHVAHTVGIIHRDLKPENVFLVTHGGQKDFVKLVDFGIAKLNDPVPGVMRTGAGMVMGTPAYMSPEQALGETVDSRTDIYSLGIILFEMATGDLPFSDPEIARVMVAQVNQAPPRPRDLNPDVPEALEAVILKALAKHALDRQQTMEELRAAIGAAVGMALPPLPPVPLIHLEATSDELNQATFPGASLATRPGGEGHLTIPPHGKSAQTTMMAPLPAAPRWKVYAWASAALAILVVGALALRGGPDQKAAARRPSRQVASAEPSTAAVTLLVTSSPSGANIVAEWSTGTASGLTPLKLELPPDTVVRLVWTMHGFVAGFQELIADRSRALMLDLRPLPRGPAASRKRPVSEADLAVPAGPARKLPKLGRPKKQRTVDQPKSDDDALYGEDIFEPVEEM